jgi:hypothetical protein
VSLPDSPVRIVDTRREAEGDLAMRADVLKTMVKKNVSR